MKNAVTTFAMSLTVAITCSAIVIGITSLASAPQRDWHGDMARMGTDVPAFLHYHPTDGDSYAGQIRSSLHLTQVSG